MGALSQEFAFTLAAAVLRSGFISRTLSPMMCSRMLVPAKPRPPGSRWLNPMGSLEAGYSRLLDVARSLRWMSCVVFRALWEGVISDARELRNAIGTGAEQGSVLPTLL